MMDLALGVLHRELLIAVPMSFVHDPAGGGGGGIQGGGRGEQEEGEGQGRVWLLTRSIHLADDQTVALFARLSNCPPPLLTC